MNRDHYARILEEIGRDTIERYDREESGRQCFGTDEAEQGGGAFRFGALDRDGQIDVLRALDENLPTKTKRPNVRTGTSYGLKHIVERYIGRYTSNLQTKTAMRILGYARSADDLNPFYNVSRREWRAFSELSYRAEDARAAARRQAGAQEG